MFEKNLNTRATLARLGSAAKNPISLLPEENPQKTKNESGKIMSGREYKG